MRFGDRYLLYYIAMDRHGYACIALASTRDWRTIDDHGVVLALPPSLRGTMGIESPFVLHRDGMWHLFYTYGEGLHHAVSPVAGQVRRRAGQHLGTWAPAPTWWGRTTRPRSSSRTGRTYLTTDRKEYTRKLNPGGRRAALPRFLRGRKDPGGGDLRRRDRVARRPARAAQAAAAVAPCPPETQPDGAGPQLHRRHGRCGRQARHHPERAPRPACAGHRLRGRPDRGGRARRVAAGDRGGRRLGRREYRHLPACARAAQAAVVGAAAVRPADRGRDHARRPGGTRGPRPALPAGCVPPRGRGAGFRGWAANLSAMRDAGLRWSSAYVRSTYGDTAPGDLCGPFRYAADGYPDLLELPAHGWPDAALKARRGAGAGAQQTHRALAEPLRLPRRAGGGRRTRTSPCTAPRSRPRVTPALPYCCLAFDADSTVRPQDPQARVVDLLIDHAAAEGLALTTLDDLAGRLAAADPAALAAPDVPPSRAADFDPGRLFA